MSRGQRIAEAVGQNARGFGALLMQLAQQRKADEARAEELAFRNRAFDASRADRAADVAHRDRVFAAGEAARAADRAASGIVDPMLVRTPAPTPRPTLSVPEPRLGMAAGTQDIGMGERLRRAVAPEPLPQPAQFTMTQGGYDPSRDVSVLRAAAIANANAAAKAAPVEPNRFTFMGKQFDTAQEVKQARDTILPQPTGAKSSPRPATEAQNRVGLLIPRAAQALTELESFVQANDGNVPEESLLGRITPGNYLLGDELQRYNQAARVIATAILRAESGATITPDEMREYERQFIPQPSDKPETVRQKLASLRATLEQMAHAAGPALEGGSPIQPLPPTGAKARTMAANAAAIASATGMPSLEEIDADPDLTTEEKAQLRALISGGGQ